MRLERESTGVTPIAGAERRVSERNEGHFASELRHRLQDELRGAGQLDDASAD